MLGGGLKLPDSFLAERWLCTRPPMEGRKLEHREAMLALRSTGRLDSVMRFMTQNLISAGPSVTRTANQQWALVEHELRSGRLCVVERPLQFARLEHGYQPSEAGPTRDQPDAQQKLEIEEPDKFLTISECPSVFDPRRESLRITYLLRKLEAQPVELLIRSKAAPEPPVHRRLLTTTETKDGASKLEWDGSDDATGKPVDRDKSPFLVELVHDTVYRDQAPTSIPPASLVHVVEMEDLMFATGRSIVLPDGGFDEHAEQGHERATGLHAIAAVLRHAAFHPDEKLCVFGHTDTVGDDIDNLQLSRDRATNVLHLLTGDVDAWASHCDQTYAVADFQRVLKWIAQIKGWPTDPGAIDNEFGDATRAARVHFRAQMNADYGTTLEQGVKQNVADWTAYFTLFDEELARILGCVAEDLQRIRTELRLTDPAAVGCGEAFPANAPGVNNLESAANRRVDLVFFELDEEPALPGDPAGAPLYASKDYVVKYLPIGKDSRTWPVILRLIDRDASLAGVEYRIEVEGETVTIGTTNSRGWVEAELPTNTPDVVLRLPTLGRSYSLEVAKLSPFSALAGMQGRLNNLGYPCPLSGQLDDETRGALRAFQGDETLPATGQADGVTIAALREAHGS
jgi:peptidoglycan hydrolase-like protein with peptidoglycan-binding domain